MIKRSAIAAVVACACLLPACASAQPLDPRDPLEPFNRKVNDFNRGVDDAAFKPIATAYERGLPSAVRAGVSNVFSNLGDAWSAVNCLLQLRPVEAAQDGMRLAVNTFFGLGGLFDIATDAGIERHKEDFGRTLTHWGVPSGPYVVLPVLGPSTLRDTAALPVDLIGDPLRQVVPQANRNVLTAARAVDTRARLLPLDVALDGAFDRYTFMRDSYLQYRSAQAQADSDGGEDPPSAAPDETEVGRMDAQE